MYDVIFAEIEKELKRFNFGRPINRMNRIYIYLLYTKYLCDKKEKDFDYETIIKSENCKFLCDKLTKHANLDMRDIHLITNTQINKCLAYIQYKDIDDLLSEFLDSRIDNENSIFRAFCDKDTKILYIGTGESFSRYIKEDIDITYVSTSINKLNISNFSCFKLLDDMYDFKREYVESLDNIDLANYDLIYLADNMPLYYINKNNDILDDIYELIYEKGYKGKILLKTSYKKVAKFNNDILLRNNLSKFLIHSDSTNLNTFIEFSNRDNDKVSIVLLDEELEKDHSKLSKLLINNRVKKDTLIKVSVDDIMENNNRIGFKMYNMENKEEVKKITDIVDDNTRLIKELSHIDLKIESEINKLLVK